MIAGMTTTTPDVMSPPAAVSLRAQADEIVKNNPPVHVLDNILVGLSIAIGWLGGMVWRYPFGYVVLLGLSVRHGYRLANPPKAPVAPQPAQPDQRTVWAAGNAVAYTEP